MLIISDFSKTFTAPDMPTTWSVFAKSWILWETYSNDRDALYDEYVHFEQEGNIEKTEEWFELHAELLVNAGLTQEQIDTIVMDDRYFAPRSGVREFLDYLIKQDIPLVIVTSGLANIVTAWFAKRYNYTPEVIFWNELIMEDGIAIWIDTDSITCPLDKALDLELEDANEDIIIIGDNREDVQIVPHFKTSIGFTDEEIGFDISLWKGGSMKDISSHL